MQRFAALLLTFLAVVASVTAVSVALRDPVAANQTAAMQLFTPGANEAAETAAYLVSMRESINQDDFLAVPFDTNNAEDAKVLEALTHNKEGFQAWRNNMARTAYHMELNDYEALFDKHRSSLLDLAGSLGITVENHRTSFDALLRRVDSEVSQRERRSPKGASGSFVEARVAISALHENAHLFRSRSTLHSLLVQDAIMFGVGDQIGEAFDWTVKKITTYKCTWCKSVLKFIRKSACDAAGVAICNLLAAAIGGPVGAVAGKFFCNFPLYLSKLFSTWCQKGISWIMDKLRLSDDCLCGFSVPNFVIPATEFKVLGVTVYSNTRRDIVIGQICVTKPGQCAGSTDTEKATYDKQKKESDEKKAKAAAEEEARVRKMTTKEKIAYHTKIISGEIKTNMSDRVIADLLTKFTGLGKSVGKTLINGAKQLAKGDVKGAVKTVVVDTAKDIASTTVKQVAKDVTAAAVKTVTTAALGATAKVLTDKGAAVANKAVADKAKQVGVAVEQKVSTVGKAAVKTTANVVGVVSKTAANTVTTKGNAAVNTVAKAAGTAAAATTKAAGNLVVDVARNSVNNIVADKVIKPTTTKLSNKISGKSTATKTEAELKAEKEKEAAAKAPAKPGNVAKLVDSVAISTAMDAKKKAATTTSTTTTTST